MILLRAARLDPFLVTLFLLLAPVVPAFGQAPNPLPPSPYGVDVVLGPVNFSASSG